MSSLSGLSRALSARQLSVVDSGTARSASRFTCSDCTVFTLELKRTRKGQNNCKEDGEDVELHGINKVITMQGAKMISREHRDPP